MAEQAVANTVQAITDAGEGDYVEGTGKLKILGGARPDARLVSAFAAMGGAKPGEDLEVTAKEVRPGETASDTDIETSLGDEFVAPALGAVADRCEELLESFPTSVVQDLYLLAGELAFTDPREWDRLDLEERPELFESMHYAELLMGVTSWAPGEVVEVDAPPVNLTPNVRLAVAYRAAKKLILLESVEELRMEDGDER